MSYSFTNKHGRTTIVADGDQSFYLNGVQQVNTLGLGQTITVDGHTVCSTSGGNILSSRDPGRIRTYLNGMRTGLQGLRTGRQAYISSMGPGSPYQRYMGKAPDYDTQVSGFDDQIADFAADIRAAEERLASIESFAPIAAAHGPQGSILSGSRITEMEGDDETDIESPEDKDGKDEKDMGQEKDEKPGGERDSGDWAQPTTEPLTGNTSTEAPKASILSSIRKAFFGRRNHNN